MKLNDVKHNHSLTDLLKVILFSIIMLLPFLDVGTRCAYVICNKNAYQSYSDSGYVEKTNVFNNSSTLIEGMDYYFKRDLSNINGNQCIIKYNSISINWYDYQNTLPTHNYEGFYVYGNSNPNFLLYYYNDNNQWVSYYSNIFVSDIDTFTFNYNSTTSSGNTFNGYYVYSYSYKQEKLDNVFEYSVSQLEQSQLYNWTTQTAVYSGVSTMTSQLGITGNIIPIIVCYWFFITIIYIILDIVIKLFTLLTHAIGSKTA